MGIFSEFHLILVAIVALLLFGNRLPSVMRSLGSGISEFKKGLHDLEDGIKKGAEEATKDARLTETPETVQTASQPAEMPGVTQATSQLAEASGTVQAASHPAETPGVTQAASHPAETPLSEAKLV
jgi:sec-independent protein translocase protein TatA